MDLTLKDAAKLFKVPEHTIKQWIEDSGLPAYRIKNQFRINRENAFEWATVKGIKISPQFISSSLKSQGMSLPSLMEAITAGGIYYGIKGAAKPTVLKSAVDVLQLPDSVDRAFLLQMLMAREAIGSTGIGGGIALPHPRNPIVLSVDKPIVSLLFLEKPVDFNAIDGKPVGLFFLLISPTVRIHLHLLSRIAYAVHDETFKDALNSKAPPEAILAALHNVEVSIVPAASASS
jgi:PTS system nitrogen regulatory IIA component